MSAAIETIRTCFPSLKDKVFDYGSDTDFKTLWDFQGLPTDRILIAWGRTAGDGALWPIDASACLSPLDWAAAYVKSLADDTVWPQILILDAIPDRQPTPPSLAHFRTLNEKQLPWLHVPENQGLKEVLQWIAKNPARPTTAETEALTRFLREIRLNLTEVRTKGDFDRHAISNIVAPMVLLGRPAIQSRHADALDKLMKATGMVFAGQVDNPVSKLQNVNIALIDDQAEHGWKEWVLSRVDRDSCSVVTSSSPCKFVTMLNAQSGADFRFSIGKSIFRNSANAAEPKLPVLLLDLRLFSGKAEEEGRFFKDTLLPIIRTKYLINGERISPLPWLGFDATPGSSFDKAVAKLEPKVCYKQESPEHLEMLTWLPRMLALADMALPIVIFSSTGRRSIVEKFKDFGNIITCFEKPRLFGEDSSAIREATERAFADALEQAKDIARAGHQIQTVLDLKLEDLATTKEAFKNVKRLEIFHEECRSQEEDDFRVATFAVGFDGQDNAYDTDEYIKLNGPRFFGVDALDKVTNKEKGEKQWNDNIGAPLSAALTAGGAGAAQVIPFVIVSGESFPVFAENGDPFALVDPSGMDNVNQELLRLLLEVVLCDTLAWIIPQHLESCHFYGATRMRSIKWGRIQPNRADIGDEISARWKIFVTNEVYIKKDYGGNYSVDWPSLRPYSFFGLLNELFAARAKSERARALGNKVTSAYGTTLPKKEETRDIPGYSYLHSIADIVARLVDITKDKVTWNCLENNADLPLKIRGVAGHRSRIVSILNCHRAIDEGDLADGFGYGLRIDHEHDLAGCVVALRLKEHAPRLTGNQFLKIVAYVKDNGPSWTHSPRLNDTMGGKPRIHSNEISAQVGATINSATEDLIGCQIMDFVKPSQGIYLSLRKIIFTGFCCSEQAVSKLSNELKEQGFSVKEISKRAMPSRSWMPHGICVEFDAEEATRLLSRLENSWFKARDGSYLYCERAGASREEKTSGNYKKQ